jgi:hypothetical protein
MSFILFSQNTVIISLNNVNQLIFVMETGSAFFEVLTGLFKYNLD